MGWATIWAILFTNASGHPDGHQRLPCYVIITTTLHAFLFRRFADNK
jgi:hypothetical protein